MTLAPIEDVSGPVDLFAPVRDYVQGFNERRRNVITPGAKVTVDESTSGWRYYSYHAQLHCMIHIPFVPEAKMLNFTWAACHM